MVRQYPAVATLIRSRLNRDLSEAFEIFHEKGVTLLTEDEDLHQLTTEKEGHKSEITDICYNGVIYRDTELVCFKGPKVEELTLEEAKDSKQITWIGGKTVFSEKIEGKKIFMYWDPKSKDWLFADENKPMNNVYSKLLKEKLYNIYNLEYFFTFVFIISDQKGKKEQGIYLESMIDNKKGVEIDWKTVWNYAMRLKVKPVQYYHFEGFEKLEPEDFPIYVLDVSNNRVLLKSMD